MKSLNPRTLDSGFVLLLPRTSCASSAGVTTVYNINPVNEGQQSTHYIV